MKIVFIAACLLFSVIGSTQTIQQVESKKVMLPNGWALTPIGRSFPLGDLPLNIAVSKSNKLMAVTNNGQSVQSIQLIDPATETVLDNVIIPKSWYGLQFSADEKKLYEIINTLQLEDKDEERIRIFILVISLTAQASATKKLARKIANEYSDQ